MKETNKYIAFIFVDIITASLLKELTILHDISFSDDRLEIILTDFDFNLRLIYLQSNARTTPTKASKMI